MTTQLIRFIIGQSQASGFTSFSDGDLFQAGPDVLILRSTGSGWSLRHTDANGRADYKRAPFAGWESVGSASELVHKLNAAWRENN